MRTNEHLKAARSAAELEFMITQICLNLDYLEPADQAKFDQIFATLYHDCSALARRAAEINSQIIHKYEHEEN